MRRTALDCPNWRTTCWQLLEEHFTYLFALELDEIAVLDSTLIVQLIELYKRYLRARRRIEIVRPSCPTTDGVLHTLALDDPIPRLQ